MSRSRQRGHEPQSILGFELRVKIHVLGGIEKYGVRACNKTCFGRICACNSDSKEVYDGLVGLSRYFKAMPVWVIPRPSSVYKPKLQPFLSLTPWRR